MIAGRYELVSLIGQGGMGQVWLAHDGHLDRKVAVAVVGEAAPPRPGGTLGRRRR
jgi:serine/threonine protein kinase